MDAFHERLARTGLAAFNLGQRADRGFERRIFADALGQASLLDPDDFAQYGVTGRALDDLRSRFATWRSELLGEEGPTLPDDSVG